MAVSVYMMRCIIGHSGRTSTPKADDLFRSVRGKGNDEVLSLAARRKTAMMKCCLAHGGNPFTKVQTLTIGGGDFDQKPEPERVRSEAEIKRLEKKWKGGTEGYLIHQHEHAPSEATNQMLRELGLEPGPIAPIKPKEQVVGPTRITCSYCGVEVPFMLMTEGTGKPRKFLTLEEIIDPVTRERRVESKIKHTAAKIVACPKHAHLIKPIIKKDKVTGEETIIHQGVKFRSLEDI